MSNTMRPIFSYIRPFIDDSQKVPVDQKYCKQAPQYGIATFWRAIRKLKIKNQSGILTYGVVKDIENTLSPRMQKVFDIMLEHPHERASEPSKDPRYMCVLLGKEKFLQYMTDCLDVNCGEQFYKQCVMLYVYGIRENELANS